MIVVMVGICVWHDKTRKEGKGKGPGPCGVLTAI